MDQNLRIIPNYSFPKDGYGKQGLLHHWWGQWYRKMFCPMPAGPGLQMLLCRHQPQGNNHFTEDRVNETRSCAKLTVDSIAYNIHLYTKVTKNGLIVLTCTPIL
jgi:hypothetical protein